MLSHINIFIPSSLIAPSLAKLRLNSCYKIKDQRQRLVNVTAQGLGERSVGCFTGQKLVLRDLFASENRTQAENCDLLGYNAASSGNFLLTFRDNLSVPSSGFKNGFLNPEDGTERSSRNVSKKLSLFAAL